MGSVLSGIKVTLYDVFGYLLPGLVLLAAVAIVFWAVYLPGQPLAINDELSIQTWSLMLVAAYLLGHMAQALSNVIEKHIPSVEISILGEQENGAQARTPHNHRGVRDRVKERVVRWLLGDQEPMPTNLCNRAREKARKMLSLKSSDQIHAESLYGICDEALSQRGQVQDREVYIYREGFYRALAIAVSFLCISFLVAAWQTDPGQVTVASWGVELERPDFLVFAGVSVVGAWLAWRRYGRFSCYRVRQAVTGFLVLKEDVQTADEEERAKTAGSPPSGYSDGQTTSSEVESFDKTIVLIASEANLRPGRLGGLLRYFR